MIAAWMLSATAMALLLGVAAMAGERALRIARRGGRLPWSIALAAALLWPPVAGPVLRAISTARGASVLAPVTVAASASALVTQPLPSLIELAAARLNAPLLVLWILVSAAMVTRLVIAVRTLRRVECSGRRAMLDDEPVVVTNSLGPAVIGIVTPRIAVPEWLTELDAPLRSLVLRHEREHCRMHDPQLMWLAALSTALMPWNAGVWWMARRLRLALEIDCDARTLAAETNHEFYGKLLLLIAQRQSGARLAPMLAESNSHLTQRIRAMKRTPSSRPLLRVILFGTVAAGAIALACSPRLATDLTNPKPAARVARIPTTSPGDVYFEFQVEKPVQLKEGAAAPVYPPALKAQGVEGKVLVQYVVDATGVPEPATLKILSTTSGEFSDAVQAVVPNMRFTPAMIGSKAVKQLVQQPFQFSLGSQAARTESQRANSVTALPGSATPRYPDALKVSRKEGEVVVQFVVNADGTPDVASFKVLRSSDPAFTDAVKAALPNMRYEPPMFEGRAVRKLVQLPFMFSLAAPPRNP